MLAQWGSSEDNGTCFKPEDLSSTPGTHVVGGGNLFPLAVLRPPCTGRHTCVTELEQVTHFLCFHRDGIYLILAVYVFTLIVCNPVQLTIGTSSSFRKGCMYMFVCVCVCWGGEKGRGRERRQERERESAHVFQKSSKLEAGEMDQQSRCWLLCRGPGFGSQPLRRGFQLSVTPVSGDLTPLPAFMGIRHIHRAHMYFQAKHSHTMNNF